MIAAADTPAADFTLQAMLLASLVGNVLVAWLQITARSTAQKREVRFEEEFASKGEVREVKEQVRSIDRDLRDLRQSISDNGEKRRVAIEARVEHVRSDLGKKLEVLSESVQDLAVSASATSSFLSAWKENPPWRQRN